MKEIISRIESLPADAPANVLAEIDEAVLIARGWTKRRWGDKGFRPKTRWYSPTGKHWFGKEIPRPTTSLDALRVVFPEVEVVQIHSRLLSRQETPASRRSSFAHPPFTARLRFIAYATTGEDVRTQSGYATTEPLARLEAALRAVEVEDG